MEIRKKFTKNQVLYMKIHFGHLRIIPIQELVKIGKLLVAYSCYSSEGYRLMTNGQQY